jgi:hypothetical protein
MSPNATIVTGAVPFASLAAAGTGSCTGDAQAVNPMQKTNARVHRPGQHRTNAWKTGIPEECLRPMDEINFFDNPVVAGLPIKARLTHRNKKEPPH